MSEIIEKAEGSRRILGDDSLLPWQQIHEALKALVPLQISDLHPRNKAALEDIVVEINRILSRYDFAENEDYQRLTAVDVAKLKQQIKSACQQCLASETDRILAELSVRDKLPREAVSAIRKHRELFIPLLLHSLVAAVEKTSLGISADEHDTFMAFCLLTEFEEPKLLPVLLDLLRLPGDGADELLGDAIHEIVAPALAMLTGECTDPIVELIIDGKVNVYVRWQAACVFKFLVRDGIISRESAIQTLHEILLDLLKRADTEGLQPDPPALFAGIVSELCDLAASESLPLIRTVFERHLVDRWVIDLPSVEEAIAAGDETVAETLANCRPTGLPDTLTELSRWACYQEASKPRTSSVADTLPKSIADTREYPPFSSSASTTFVRTDPKIGRNDPCHCGSGKKYKKCCL